MKNNLQKAYFAGGCFWGVEYYFQSLAGVTETKVGYMGGYTDNPNYEEVSNIQTGHAETVEVIFDETKISYEELAKLFFEIHDFAQLNGQGPDIGEQYRSAIFYTNDEQKKTLENLIKILNEKGYKVATEVKEAGKFWEGEEYHQKYYEKNGKLPYCHFRKNIF